MRVKLSDRTDKVAAFRVRRRFYFWGRWLRHSALYPTWVVRLVHRDRVRYFKSGHGEGQETRGTIGELSADLIDENGKGIDEWFQRQNQYARWEAEHELADTHPLDLRTLLLGDPLERRIELKRLSQRMPGRAGLYFLYSYVLRGVPRRHGRIRLLHDESHLSADDRRQEVRSSSPESGLKRRELVTLRG